MGHVLWGCPKAKEAYECSKLVSSSTDQANLSFQDVMWKLLMNEDVGEDHVTQVVTIAWAQWHIRNEVRFGGGRKLGQQIFRWASDHLKEYRAAMHKITQ